jgi:methylisocitrate lyase
MAFPAMAPVPATDKRAALRAGLTSGRLLRMPGLDARTLADLGVNLVVYPVTGLRLAMGAVEEGLRRLRDDGTQAGLLDRMQTRARLYELLGYGDYAAFDRDVHDFEL